MLSPERTRISSYGASTFYPVFFFAAVIGIAHSSVAEEGESNSAMSRLSAVHRAQLRYDGRSFEEWQREFLTEINPAKRVAALPALTRFGRHGYAVEAAATIVEALNGCFVWQPRLSEHGQQFRQSAVELLVVMLNQPDVQKSTSTLAQRVPQRDVLNLLAMYGPRAAPAVGSLIRLLKSPEPWKRCAASDVLGGIGPKAALAKVVLQELAADQTDAQNYVELGWPAVSLQAGRRPAALYVVHLPDASADCRSPLPPLPPLEMNSAEASAWPRPGTIGIHARAALFRIERAAQ
jgi:hypothetical protein